MSAGAVRGGKNLYVILHVPRTATKHEIKLAYRKIALALHPDRHNGCPIKGDDFKEASEAYKTLSDHSARTAYDRALDGIVGADGRPLRRNAPPRDYRKVYSPQAPKGFKIFDRQRHFDMHYGDGMMNEEIERARKRAEACSDRFSGLDYTSPLGPGFSFDESLPPNRQRNPYSKHSRQGPPPKNGGIRIDYEETYFEMHGSDLGKQKNGAKRAVNKSQKENVVDRMHERRKTRTRERGQPLQRRMDEPGCVIM